jgi:5-formyltetrahydrofolate cyclo-ligase
VTKAELRAEYRQARRALTEADIRAKSTAITEPFGTRVPLDGVRVLHTFLPIRRQDEVDTWVLIHKIWRSYPQIRVVIPKVDEGTVGMTHYELRPDTPLTTNRWGGQEPLQDSGLRIQDSEIDLIVVPLLAYDTRGYRVGYGKGYYDRFLAHCRPDVRKVGVSFFRPVARILDVDAHDIPLDVCVTPEGVLSFR